MVPELLILALDYYRAPLHYRHLTYPDRPLPESFEDLIGAFAAALSPQNIQTTAQELATNSASIESASLFFLRQVLMAPGSDHYRILGLSPDASAETIREHYQLLVRIFHPDKSAGDPERDTRYTARINDAYNTLRKPHTRKRYDRQLASAPRSRQPTRLDDNRLRPGTGVAPDYPFESSSMRFLARNRRLRPLLFAVAGIAAAAAIALVLWTSSSRPALRANPELANESIAEPSFLQQRTSSQPVSRFPPNPETSPETIVASAQDRTHRKTPAPAAASPAAAFAAEREPGETSSLEQRREEPRDEVTTGLDPYPEAKIATEVEAPATNATFSPAQPVAKNRSQTTAKIASTAQEPKRAAKAAAPTKRLIEPKGASVKDGKERPPGTTSDAKQAQAPKVKPRATREAEEKSIRSKPAQKTRVRQQPPPEKMLARLTRYYRAGDVRGFASLFTANARVKKGRGTAFIRSDYARLFSQTSDRRLSVRNLKWQRTGNGNLIGRGKYRAGTKISPDASWRYSTGTLRIKLVPWAGSYKISELIH